MGAEAGGGVGGGARTLLRAQSCFSFLADCCHKKLEMQISWISQRNSRNTGRGGQLGNFLIFPCFSLNFHLKTVSPMSKQTTSADRCDCKRNYFQISALESRSRAFICLQNLIPKSAARHLDIFQVSNTPIFPTLTPQSAPTLIHNFNEWSLYPASYLS